MIHLVTFLILAIVICWCMQSAPRNFSAKRTLNIPFLKGTAQAGFQNESSSFPKSDWENYVKTVHKCISSPNHLSLSVLRADLIRLKHMQGNCYRFSIEWARVSPSFYDFDMEYYINVCAILKDLNLRPIITLFHFVLPPWARNVWTNDQPWFVQFAKKVITSLASFNPIWITLNEPFLYALHGYITGSRPPFKKKPSLGLRVLKNMLVNHSEIYRFAKHQIPDCLVGIAKNFMPVHADYMFNPIEQALKYQFSNWFNTSFYNFLNTGEITMWLLGSRVKHNTNTFPVCDFVGVNHYTEMTFTTGIANPINVELRPPVLSYGYAYTKAGWYVTPQSWFETLKGICSKVDLPIIVTECGVSQLENQQITRKVAMENILNTFKLFPQIQGVLVWTLIDNIEWESGNEVKFGIFNLEREKTEIYKPVKRFFKSKT